MKVYMLKDVEKVGMAGQVVKVSDGYAMNFLIPRKLAKKVEIKVEAGAFCVHLRRIIACGSGCVKGCFLQWVSVPDAECKPAAACILS